MALHSGLVFKPTLPLTSTPHIFTLPLTANLSLPPLASLLFLQTTRLCCCEPAAADRPFLIINHSWLHSQAGPRHVSSHEFMGFEKKELLTPEKTHISRIKSPCQGKHSGQEEEESGDREVLVQPCAASRTVSAQQRAHCGRGKKKVGYR